jgi:hypothetical protein
MSTWHEHQAAIQEYNAAMELEGNRYGPVHPRWKEHNDSAIRAQESVQSTFHAAAAAEGVDPVASTRAALESAYDRQVSEYDNDARRLDTALTTAKKLPAAKAVEVLGREVGHTGWQPMPKTKLMATAAERRDAAVAARDTLIQRPHSVHADQNEIAEHFPAALRDHVQRLPSPVVEDLRSRAREFLRPAMER